MAADKQAFRETSNALLNIRVSKDGPYVVSGGIPLEDAIIITDANGISHEWRAGKQYVSPGTYELCRCGESRNKPFCDGTHRDIGFDGTEKANHQPYLNQAKVIDGPDLRLTDAPPLCVHARFCDRAGGIWKSTERSGDPEARRIAIEEAGNCPSGRLVVWDREGNEIEPRLKPSIELVEDPYAGVSGPIWVRGGITVESAAGAAYEVRNRVALCRCGKSASKPFCDGVHLNK